MIRIALAGFSQGYYAITYMRYLACLKDIQLLAVCDCEAPDDYVQECACISAKTFAQELNVPLIHNYEQLLKQNPDALLICGETAEHVRMAKAACEKGIHVFVSKPLSFSLWDITQLRSTQKGSVLLCGNPLKYEQGIEEMHAKLAAGAIGKVYSLRMMINHLAMTKQAWERNETRSGGPLGTYGIYLFDLACWLTGEPLQQLYAVADNYCTPEIETPDTVKVLGKGREGSQFTLELYSAIHHDYPFVQVEAVGETGTLVTRYDNYATIVQTSAGTSLGTLRASDMGAEEMNHFLVCIQGKAKERCSLEDMDYVARCIEATWESIRLKAVVAIQSKEKNE